MPTSSSGWVRFRPQAETELAQDYLGFRHFFRNAYSFHFDWAEMGTLVLDSERTLQRFSGEIADFLAKEPPAGDQPTQT